MHVCLQRVTAEIMVLLSFPQDQNSQQTHQNLYRSKQIKPIKTADTCVTPPPYPRTKQPTYMYAKLAPGSEHPSCPSQYDPLPQAAHHGLFRGPPVAVKPPSPVSLILCNHRPRISASSVGHQRVRHQLVSLLPLRER